MPPTYISKTSFQNQSAQRYDRFWFVGITIVILALITLAVLTFVPSIAGTTWEERLSIFWIPSSNWTIYAIAALLVLAIIAKIVSSVIGDPVKFGRELMQYWQTQCGVDPSDPKKVLDPAKTLLCSKKMALEECKSQFRGTTKINKCRLGVNDAFNSLVNPPVPSAKKKSFWDYLAGKYGFTRKTVTPTTTSSKPPSGLSKAFQSFKAKFIKTPPAAEIKVWKKEEELLKEESADTIITENLDTKKRQFTLEGSEWSFEPGYNRFGDSKFYAVKNNGDIIIEEWPRGLKIGGKKVEPNNIPLPRHSELRTALIKKLQAFEATDTKKQAELAKEQAEYAEKIKKLSEQIAKEKNPMQKAQMRKQFETLIAKTTKKLPAVAAAIPQADLSAMSEEMMMEGEEGEFELEPEDLAEL